jgi:hypothetical protein
MHRFPEGARFDVVGLEVLTNLGGPDPEAAFFEEHASQPARRAAFRRFWQERYPIDPLERHPVPLIDLSSPLNEPVQPRELCSADGGQKVAQSVVVADLFVLVVRHRLPRLRGQVPRSLHESRVITE